MATLQDKSKANSAEHPTVRHHADVVIVGAGICGAIMAKELANAGQKVLLIEAGRATSIRPEGYASYVEYFQQSLIKTPNSPYPQIPNAPSPEVLEQAPIVNNVPVTGGYQVYLGKLPFMSNYTKVLGGTTLHFLGTCMRLLPADFEMRSRYGKAVDWPIRYGDLESHYEQAELEIGVSADVEEQKREGAVFRDGYQYPMQQIPKSYLDRWLDHRLKGMQYRMGGEMLPVKVVGTPAGRNGNPNPQFIDRRTGKPYRPQGSPYDSRVGQRCEGNSACVPICPVMAKYNALKTLYTLNPGADKNLHILTQTIATKIQLSENGKEVTGILCRQYQDESIPSATDVIVTGAKYVIAAHAIETAKLLLASGAANNSDQVGRNLMDHPYYLTWGLAPKNSRLGVYRGPQITSELPMRDGKFRNQFAAFRGDIRNGGWDFSCGSPYSNVNDLVQKQGLFGKSLRSQLRDDIQRQIGFGFEIEQLPDPNNRVTIDDRYRDQLGNYRPVLTYNIDDYSMNAVVETQRFSKAVLEHVGGENLTEPLKQAAGNVEFEGQTYTLYGSGHVVGTHRMGTDSKNSVVNSDLRTWDHHNLYLVGCGSMPTLGTSNPTLTAAAFAYRAVAAIRKELSNAH